MFCLVDFHVFIVAPMSNLGRVSVNSCNWQCLFPKFYVGLLGYLMIFLYNLLFLFVYLGVQFLFAWDPLPWLRSIILLKQNNYIEEIVIISFRIFFLLLSRKCVHIPAEECCTVLRRVTKIANNNIYHMASLVSRVI